MSEHSELASLDRSELEDEHLARCIEMGKQVSEIWRLQAQRDALLAACKAAYEWAYQLYGIGPIAPKWLVTAKVAIAKAEGKPS